MAEIAHEPSQSRFVLHEQDGTAELAYDLSTNVVTVRHTFVPTQWRGRGVAALLMRALLAWVERENLRVRGECSYAVVFLDRYPEFAHLRADNQSE